MERILVVEDDLTLSAGLCFELDNAGYLTVAAYNCTKARRLLKSDSFDLALLDVNLPDGNGFGLCREIKEGHPDLPVIFLTANDLESDILEGFDQGAEDYVTKPFNIQILLRRIDVALRRRGKKDEPAREWNDGFLSTAALQDRQAGAVLYGMDGIPLDTITQQQYLMQGEFDADAFSGGDYVLAVGPSADPDQKYSLLPAPSVGSQVTLDGKSYTVMAVVYPLTPVMEGASEKGAPQVLELSFILPLDTFQDLYPDVSMRKLFVNVDDAHLGQTQEWLEEYTGTVDTSLPVTSRQTMAEQYEAETRSSAVMGNAVSIIIALVGILNFVNSMITAIVSRRREFAMIQSVGMTKKQLCRMLVYEGLYYAGITLAVSYAVSALAVGVVIRAMVAGGFTTFHFTLLPLGICTPVLLIFAVLIPFLCFKNLEKQSIVERLRME